MKHAIEHIQFIGMVGPNREQGSCLRDVTGREDRQMPMLSLTTGGER
jgi:hypothetical protein